MAWDSDRREIRKFGRIDAPGNNVVKRLLERVNDTAAFLFDNVIRSGDYTDEEKSYLTVQLTQIQDNKSREVAGLSNQEIEDTRWVVYEWDDDVEEKIGSALEREMRIALQSAIRDMEENGIQDAPEGKLVLAPWMLTSLLLKAYSMYQTAIITNTAAQAWLIDSVAEPIYQTVVVQHIQTLLGSARRASMTYEELDEDISTTVQTAVIAFQSAIESLFDARRANMGRAAPPEYIAKYVEIKTVVEEAIRAMQEQGTLPFIRRVEESGWTPGAARETQSEATLDPYFSKDAMYIVDLPLTCAEVKDYLRYMDAISPYIPLLPEEVNASAAAAAYKSLAKANYDKRAEFENYYRMLRAYKTVFCDIGDAQRYGFWVTDTAYVPRSNIRDTELSTEDRSYAKRSLHEYVDEVWRNAEAGDGLPPGIRGGTELLLLAGSAPGGDLSAEYEDLAARLKQQIHADIDYAAGNPYAGPVMLDNRGVFMPYDYFESGEDLYKMWITRRVREAFEELNELVLGGEDSPGIKYAPTYDTLTALCDWLKKGYDDALAAYDDSMWGSVKAAHWEPVRIAILSYERKPFNSADEMLRAFLIPEVDTALREADQELRQLSGMSRPSGGYLVFTQGSVFPLAGDKVEGKETGTTAEVTRFAYLYGKPEKATVAGYLYLTSTEGFGQEEISINGEKGGALSAGSPARFVDYENDANSSAYLWLPTSEIRTRVEVLQSMQRFFSSTDRERFESVYSVYWNRLLELSGTTWETWNPNNRDEWIRRQTEELTNAYGPYKDLADALGLLAVSTAYNAALASVQAKLDELPAVGSATQVEAQRRRTELRDEAAQYLANWFSVVQQLAVEKLNGLLDAMQQAAEHQTPLDGDIPALITRLHNVPAERMFDPTMKEALKAVLDYYDQNSGSFIYEGLAQLEGGVFNPFCKFEGMKPGVAYHVSGFLDEDLAPIVEEFVPQFIQEGISVEPKLNGFRATLQCRNGVVRIFLEGTDRNMSDVYPGIAAALAKGPDVTLEAELLERIGGSLEAWPEEGATRKEINNSTAVAMVFDCLYLDGQTLERSPYKERRQALAKYFTSMLSDVLVMIPNTWCRTPQCVVRTIQTVQDYAGSEGAMLKSATGTYKFGKTKDWAKVKARMDVYATVLSRKRNKRGMWTYECGVAYDGEPGLADGEIVTLHGDRYAKVGTTFGTDIEAEPGDTLRVAVTELLEHGGKGEARYRWQDPLPQAVVVRRADSLGRAVQVGRILQASVSQPYRKLDEAWREARSTDSRQKLLDLKQYVFQIYSDLNFARLRRIATAVLDYLNDRLGEISPTSLGALGYDAYAMYATRKQLEDLRQMYRGISAAIETEPGQKLARLQSLARVVKVRSTKTEDPVLKSDFEAFLAEIEKQVQALGNLRFDLTPSGVALEIGQQLVYARNLLDQYNTALAQNDTPTADAKVAEAVHLKQYMDEIVSKISWYGIANAAEIREIYGITDEIMGEDKDLEIQWREIPEYLERVGENLRVSRDELEKLADEWASAVNAQPSPSEWSLGSFAGVGDEGSSSGLADISSFAAAGKTVEEVQADYLAAARWRGVVDGAFEVLRYLTDKLSQKQLAVYGGWMTQLHDQAYELRIDWESMGAKIVKGKPVTGALSLAILAASEVLGPGGRLAYEALAKYMDEHPMPESIEAGTREILAAYPTLPGDEEPWKALRMRLAWEAEKDNLKFTASEFLQGGSPDKTAGGLLADTAFGTTLLRAVQTADSQLEAKTKAYPEWVEDTNPYPLAEEGVVPVEAVWIDGASVDSYRSGCAQSNSGADCVGGEALQKLVDSGFRVLVQASGGRIDVLGAVNEETGDIVGDTDALVRQIASGIESALTREPTVTSILRGAGVEAAESYQRNQDAVVSALSGVVVVGEGCGGVYIGPTATGGRTFITSAHCFEEPKQPGDKVWFDALTGERIVGIVRWAKNPQDATSPDLVIVEVADPREVAKTDKMTPLDLATQQPDVAIVPSPIRGEADVIIREHASPAPYQYIYAGIDRARQGYSGCPVIDESGRVAGIWMGRNFGAFGTVAPNRRGIIVPFDAIRAMYERAGLDWPFTGTLPEAERTSLTASSVPAFLKSRGKGELEGRWLVSRGERPWQRLVFAVPGGETSLSIIVKGQGDGEKLENYQGGKLPVTLTYVLDEDEEQLDTVRLLPSRIRKGAGNNLYYEFYLAFDKHPSLSGLWAVSEEAAKDYDFDAFLFRLKNETPFWKRKDKKHARERAQLKGDERPTVEQITEFLGRPPVLKEE